MIKLTPTAASEIQNQAKQGNMEGLALRVAVRADDSGAFEYGIGFDEAGESDISIESEGVTLLIAPVNEEMLKGATIDYVEIEPGKFHFIFLNPNDPNYVPPSGHDSGLDS
ncbi:MAG: iron-sulfur cluster assembly accessory protein [Gammaproteobacteria bacterium]|nr:iron-sulfur cluster assembly accessory protein [Gammaproteobacteria bacterium]